MTEYPAVSANRAGEWRNAACQESETPDTQCLETQTEAGPVAKPNLASFL